MTIKFFRTLAMLMAFFCAFSLRAGTVTYIYSDAQGTPLAEANENGIINKIFDYRPYGGAALGGLSNGPAYTGHVSDSDSGLTYMQARYYDPVVGRFLSIDPEAPHIGSIFSANRFLYASANPVLNVDPDGRDDCSSACMKLRELSDHYSGVSQKITGNMSGTSGGALGTMNATINAGANSALASSLQQASDQVDNAISALPGGSAAMCAIDGCGVGGWTIAVIGVIPGEGLEGRLGLKVGGQALRDFNQARNAAVSWLEGRGFRAEQATIGKFGGNAGKPIGMKTADGRIGFRVEFDARNGAHINVWAGREKAHINFEGTESMVDNIIKQFNK